MAYLRRLLADGGVQIELCPQRVQQWPPEQHLPPPQQSARCAVAVAVLIVARAIIIIKRYFMKVPPVKFRLHLAHACASRREPIVKCAAVEPVDDRIVMLKRCLR